MTKRGPTRARVKLCLHCRKRPRHRTGVWCLQCNVWGEARARRAVAKAWWDRTVHRDNDKTAYFMRVCSELEQSPANDELLLRARKLRVHT